MWPPVAFTHQMRNLATRLLCALVLLGLAAFYLVFGLLALQLLGIADIEWRLVMTPLLGVALMYCVGGVVLFVWRSCDRCDFHFYSIFGSRLLAYEIVRPNLTPRSPYFAAKRVLGSFGLGAVWCKTISGEATCTWCGHPDRAVAPT